MKAAPIPDDEPLRQAALERYEVLDTLPERSYDDITALMAQVCDVPISLVGLIDRGRNWLKSCHGISLDESPRDISFCGHAIVSGEAVFVVEDARTDPRFADNPLVTELGVVAYAGAPLVDADGFALGTLCVFDTRPRTLTAAQREALANMARQVTYLLERHLRERSLERAGRELAERNAQLEHVVGAVAHDIREPVINIATFLELIGEDVGDVALRAEIDRLRECSLSLRDYIDGLLSHYLASDPLETSPTVFRLASLFLALEHMLVRAAPVAIRFPEASVEVRTHRAALQQVLFNLVGNAIKYGASEVEIGFAEEVSCYRFSVGDDGPGIAPERHASIFELFESGLEGDRDGVRGSGIGLATVSRLLSRLGGEITLDSAPGRGSTFSFTLPRTPSAEGSEAVSEAA